MITQCQHGVDTEAGWSTLHSTRPVRRSASRSAIKSNTWSLAQKSSKTSQFSVIRRFIEIGSPASESYYRSYIYMYIHIYIYIYAVDTSGVNRLASQICHNRFFRKKLQHNLLPMISTEIPFLATHNTSQWELSKRSHFTHRVYVLMRLHELRHHVWNILSHNWVRIPGGLSNGETAPRDQQLMKYLLLIVALVLPPGSM
jgi:hypothetical protein